MIKFKIYDDTKESTLNSDLKWSSYMIILLTVVSFGVGFLGIFGGDRLFNINPVYAVFMYFVAGILSLLLYRIMHNAKRYPAVYATLAAFIFGYSGHFTGILEKGGFFLLVVSTIIMVFYVFAVLKYDLDWH